MTESDHDLLIRIDTNHIAFNRVFQEHIIQDAKEFANIDLKVSAAHRRIDSISKVFSMMAGVGSFLGIVSLIVGIMIGLRQVGIIK